MDRVKQSIYDEKLGKTIYKDLDFWYESKDLFTGEVDFYFYSKEEPEDEDLLAIFRVSDSYDSESGLSYWNEGYTLIEGDEKYSYLLNEVM